MSFGIVDINKFASQNSGFLSYSVYFLTCYCPTIIIGNTWHKSDSVRRIDNNKLLFKPCTNIFNNLFTAKRIKVCHKQKAFRSNITAHHTQHFFRILYIKSYIQLIFYGNKIKFINSIFCPAEYKFIIYIKLFFFNISFCFLIKKNT